MQNQPRVYLDHNATSPIKPEVFRAMQRVFEQPAANPASAHFEGREAKGLLEKARSQVASLLHADKSEIVFTSGGSEAIAAAIRGVTERAPRDKRRLVVPSIEHSAVKETAKIASKLGFVVVEIPCRRDGRIDLEAYKTQLGGDDIALAMLQWANPETGVLQPVSEVGRICRMAGIPFFVDAVQVAGKLPIDPRDAFADLLAISAHKLGGPQGSGALYVRKGIQLASLIGGVQETRRRGGTPALANIVGFGAACQVAEEQMDACAKQWLRWRSRLETRLREHFPDVRIHGQDVSRLPNTLNFALPEVPGEMLAIGCDLAGFAVSTGSACASGAIEPSHVIRAMGFADEEAKGAVRLSLGWNTSRDDIDQFLEAIPEVVERVREGLKTSVDGLSSAS